MSEDGMNLGRPPRPAPVIKPKLSCVKYHTLNYTVVHHACRMYAIRVVIGIKNAIGLIHSDIGCSFNYKSLYQQSPLSGEGVFDGGCDGRIFCTNIKEGDIIFGADEKLKKSIIIELPLLG